MRLIEVRRLGRVIATILALEVTLVLIHKPVGLMVSRHHRRLALLLLVLLVMGVLRLWRVPLWLLLLLRLVRVLGLVRMLGLMGRKPLSRPLLPLRGSRLSNDRILSIFRKPDRNPFSSMPKFEAPHRCHRILRLCLILIINKCDPLTVLVPCQSNLIKAFKALEK